MGVPIVMGDHPNRLPQRNFGGVIIERRQANKRARHTITVRDDADDDADVDDVDDDADVDVDVDSSLSSDVLFCVPENILDERYFDGVKKYLISWEGKPAST